MFTLSSDSQCLSPPYLYLWLQPRPTGSRAHTAVSTWLGQGHCYCCPGASRARVGCCRRKAAGDGGGRQWHRVRGRLVVEGSGMGAGIGMGGSKGQGSGPSLPIAVFVFIAVGGSIEDDLPLTRFYTWKFITNV